MHPRQSPALLISAPDDEWALDSFSEDKTRIVTRNVSRNIYLGFCGHLLSKAFPLFRHSYPPYLGVC